jgi:peroxiredoxin
MLPRTPTILVWISIVIGSLVLGGVGGKVLSGYVNSSRESEAKQKRAEMQQAILQEMGTLAVGDTLADHVFESLDLTPVRLSELVTGPTVLSIVDPDCEVCVEEITMLRRELSDSVLQSRFVFISAGNPRYLAELVDSTGLLSPVLYDHHSAWLGQYKVFTYPFNLIVNSDLRIMDVIASELSFNDLQELENKLLAR